VKSLDFKTAIVAVLILSVSLALGSASASVWSQINRTTLQVGNGSPNILYSQWMGDGEDYESYVTHQAPPANVTAGWDKILQNVTTPPTDYVDKFQWRVFELALEFYNLNTSNPNHHDYNATLMDEAISALHSRGYYVILAEYDWTNFGSSTWVRDWVNVAQHYKGNTDILGFNLYSEPGCWPQDNVCTWSKNVTTYQYNSTESVESAYANATAAIHAVDPSRTVIWYAPYLQWTLDPKFAQPNVIYDYHLYNGNTSERWISETINYALKFETKYDTTAVCLELDSAGTAKGITNITLANYTVKLLESDHLSWVDWEYSLFQRWWIPILNYVPGLDNVSSSSQSSSPTPDSNSTVSSSSSSPSATVTSLTNSSASNGPARGQNSSANNSDSFSYGNIGGAWFGLDQNRVSALTYGVSTSSAVLLLGFIPIAAILKRNRR
jgi:hypothetical protein